MSYTPSAAAIAAALQLATNLDGAAAPGPWPKMLAGDVSSLPSQALMDALITSLVVPTVQAKSAAFTAVVGYHYRVDTTGGDVTATLPAPSAANAGTDVTFKKLVAANFLNVAAAALIDGATPAQLAAQWASLTVRSTGATWDIV